MNPLTELLQEKRILILDGALATELERKGCDLDHPLWSARLLLEDPRKIEEVHVSYLEAGVDCIITSGYQSSAKLYLDSIRVALKACAVRQDRPLVAASIGPYGAFLADGSEYRGNYGIDEKKLERFHRDRIEIAAREILGDHEGPDLIAFETIPSLPEALVLARILESHPGVSAWMSFSCRDDATTCEGQRIDACAEALERFPQIVAVGVNCTAPNHITPLIRALAGVTKKPIVVYPNSGETYDPSLKRWSGDNVLVSPGESVAEWVEAGATIVGGCCRTTPEDIASMVRYVSRRFRQ